ncbi:MAG: hypothetical protein GWP91_22470 [Rhodobacterales bacterium]|nr:hypothetical protein [Rhodobacterales bacterium]
MHRAKTPELFENPKVVIQRLRGRGTVRAALDLDGVYVGHTCTVVQLLEPHGNVTLDKILELVRSPIVDAITRIERGQRLDLYPRDVGAFPVPVAWVRGEEISPEEAWGLTGEELVRLASVSAR